MLVQFTLKNVLSFKEKTVLDMTAINAYKEHESNLIDIGTKEKFLRVAAVYGANASGKSNLHYAMFYFQKIVARSFDNVDDEQESVISQYYVPFLFDGENRCSEFEVVEIVGDYEYRYGFEYNDELILSEWMYRKNLKTNRNVVIVERVGSEITFGASVRKECEVYKEQIPAETLVLSFYNKLRLNTDVFNILYSAIRDTMVAPTDFYEGMAVVERFLPVTIDKEKNKLLEFLKAIDTGIIDIEYEKSDKDITFYTTHKGMDNQLYKLDLCGESEGTIKSIAIYMNVRAAVLGNKSIFVDELNNKLHPLLLKFIVDLFYDKDSTAQLIYTTHDTTLMDKKFFRRDQIWFVQKDEYGCSELLALSDFKVRSDASFEKDYLAGVYGGIPFLKEFEVREGE